MIRSIEQIFSPPSPHMVGDGFRVHNFIPGIPHLSMQRMDPFIMLDYNSKHYFAPSDHPRGVDVHPHRGFETVTIAYHGRIAHHDSNGNSGIIHEGEVQWMTAASGILHKEYHEQEFNRQGGYFQMVQLWVNLPSRYKMSEPKYQNITRDKIVKINDDYSTLEIIAGEYQNQKGPANTFTKIHLYNLMLQSGGEKTFSFPNSYTTAAVIIEGDVMINTDQSAKADQFVLFKNDGEEIKIKAINDSIILILSAEPIREPISAYGPFVMNTREEIVQAFNDYQSGKFGVLN